MRNEIRKKNSGKTVDTAASAETPSICPTKTALTVLYSDCRMLLPISGSRNASMARHSGASVAIDVRIGAEVT